ncbi:MAG: RNA polymerase sigma factor RpoH [Alphaproteobacteria bacterium]|nr:RNA polymerase sigma factor RpoH [Alphaproteobacteria bacterium]
MAQQIGGNLYLYGGARNTDDSFSSYLRAIQEFPMLEAEEEYMLAKKWLEQNDKDAAEKLINSHLRLVAKIASGYRGYRLPLSDLISEGVIGIIQALKRYNPEKGFRFSTYATWWIRARLNDYVLRSWSLVRVGTTNSQKKLFFSLKKVKNSLQQLEKDENLPENVVKKIADKLNVTKQEVMEMEQRLSGPDYSLNSPVGEEEEAEWQDWLEDESDNQETQYAFQEELFKRRKLLNYALECLNPREHKIFLERRLSDSPATLSVVAEKYGLSRERVRQIEKNAFDKVQKAIIRKATEMHLSI